ncbi:MAG: glutamine-hydrolyzing GMP synthase [Eubacterium aggregans]|uniref:GMP synthase [glutamine-hydrolyzing] n=1 Tax=Eubacterium aggregans TaxID=81409 RepID=A0A1H4A050_9FIRM|nr:glutamine-hydrolyzing GMP synthase [Eubacterium aggregans]MEA5074259.1 glutamine-hydrolyzing GMP synthase [Eubacterium aggregans]SEA29280.1 GMP synthase (glutamine-hydrolysing) [Eubacterium aggregans]
MSEQEKIIIIDFGAQYNQLIARRVREERVYSEVVPYDVSIERIKEMAPKGIIFTGGPSSVHQDGAPRCNPEIYTLGIPVLGICYGAQLMAEQNGGKTDSAEIREYGKKALNIKTDSQLLESVRDGSVCWMSHTNYIDQIPEGFTITATTETCPVAAMENPEAGLYAVQYHPEVEHTECGREVLHNFIYNICRCEGTWTMANFVEEQIAAIRERVGDKKVLCALSGGVDSSVASTLVFRAIGDQLTCIFVDHGLLRKDEGDQVEAIFKDRFKMNFIRANCQDRFLSKLAGVTDPERKRKIIGEEFIRVFEEESGKLKGMEYLLQGTIYPDVIESGTKDAAVIKSHHNVGGLPEDVDFELIEPLRNLFKDEVRALGEELGLDHDLVWRQPFPGPGLAIRVMGEVTGEKLDILREADYVFRDEIAKAGLDQEIWQYFAVLPGNRSVGVMGDERTYDYTIGLRAVTSVDGMTSDWARIPFDVLESISTRIVNEVPHVNRIVYDITSKPPSTIEWE